VKLREEKGRYERRKRDIEKCGEGEKVVVFLHLIYN